MLVRYTCTWPRTSNQVQSPSTPDVPQTVFEFDVEQVRTAVDVVACYSKWIAPRGNGSPIVNAWRRHHPHRLIEWIREQPSPVVEIVDKQWRSWPDIFYQLLRERAFQRVSCGLCSQSYAPDAIATEPYEWYGGPSTAYGGVRYLCPSGHCLYFVMDWIS